MSKDAQAVQAVLDYLNYQNRPYSSIDIFNNLHKEYGKTAIVKACESLAENRKIKEKINGKQKVYSADQSQFPDVDDTEIKAMDAKIIKLGDDVKTTTTVVQQLESEMKHWNSSISTEEAQKQLEELTSQVEEYKKKLSSLKEGGVVISEKDREAIYSARTKYAKEWRKRKRITNDILGAILEGYPNPKKQLYEEVGIETDEDYNVTPPQV
ncbi:hypothetical protein ScPMuIL_015168 [Solemya velum]